MKLWSDKLAEKYKKQTSKNLATVLHDWLDSKWSPFTVLYRLNWHNKKLVNVSDWLRNQIDKPYFELLNAAGSIRYVDAEGNLDSDKTVVYALRFVKDHLKYKPDILTWKAIEYWAEAYEALEMGEDDCDGYAVLLFVLCRLAGVPANQIRVQCGPVVDPNDPSKTVGHAYVKYRANKDFKWYILDGCYHSDFRGLYRRFNTLDSDLRYHKEWWSCTDCRGYGEFKLE